MTRDWTVEWDCNWKTSVDAFNETYHVQGIHPQLLYYLDDYDVQIDCYERHSRYLVPFATISHRVRETTEIPPLLKLIMKDAGMDPAEFDGRVPEVRRAVQRWKREHGPAQGHDYSDLNDDQLTDDYHYLIFPNIALEHARRRPDAVPPAPAPDRPGQDVLRSAELPAAEGGRGAAAAAAARAVQARRKIARPGARSGRLQSAGRAARHAFDRLSRSAYRRAGAAHPPFPQGDR